MAFRKTLSHRLYHISKISSPTLNYSPFTSPCLQAIIPPNPGSTTFRRDFLNSSDSGAKGFFRRFFQSKTSAEFSSMLIGDKMMNKLKNLNFNGDRLRLDGLYPPLEKKPEPPEEISIEDARKILRVSQVEMLKSKLRHIPKNCILYSEFLEICLEGSTHDEGLRFAKMLDDSGSVIVLGNVVFLRPEQAKRVQMIHMFEMVTKAIEGLIPLSLPQPNDPRRKELENMEKEKALIDNEAESLVRKELWAGLGFLVVQTAGFMRLTFWELSWDVMEPICFYLTSIYFMAGYSFFLRTNKEPSFEGLFESRFNAKQKRLMRKKKFDVQRFNELSRACYPLSGVHSFENFDRNLAGALHN